MNKRTHFARALLAAVLLVASMAAWAGRPGTIIEMRDIENKGSDESKRTQVQRGIGQALGDTATRLGGLFGASRSRSSTETMVVTTAAGAAAPVVGQKAGDAAASIGGKGPAVRYMVKVRLDSRKVLVIPQLASEMGGLTVGSRVMVEGTGDQARITPLRK